MRVTFGCFFPPHLRHSHKAVLLLPSKTEHTNRGRAMGKTKPTRFLSSYAILFYPRCPSPLGYATCWPHTKAVNSLLGSLRTYFVLLISPAAGYYLLNNGASRHYLINSHVICGLFRHFRQNPAIYRQGVYI